MTNVRKEMGDFCDTAKQGALLQSTLWNVAPTLWPEEEVGRGLRGRKAGAEVLGGLARGLPGQGQGLVEWAAEVSLSLLLHQ